MAERTSKSSTGSIAEEVHLELLRAFSPDSFSRAGHLWLIAHLGGYLATRHFTARADDAKRRAIVAAIKGFLDAAWERRDGALFLDVISELGAAEPVPCPVIDGILKTAAVVGKSPSNIQARRAVSRRFVKKTLLTIEADRTSAPVARWLRHSWRAFQQAVDAVANHSTTQGTLDTATDALVSTRYVSRWLIELSAQDTTAALADAAANANAMNSPPLASLPAEACTYLRDSLQSNKFSHEELLQIHNAFAQCVLDLPSVDVNRAAELIGVTVDRVHRLAALGVIDTFYIRRRVPKAEVTAKQKGAARRSTEIQPAESPALTATLVDILKSTQFSIPELLDIQSALSKRIVSASFPLKAAVERLGYSEVHVHLLLRRGKIKSFGLARCIPESEAIRLQRDPNQPHMGRPRISEGGL
ncbi:MAG: hypothetical protein KDA92_07990 [Planctomycetales bacterium]|nr:hypothetical protein [Planctomycetales bacterium]